jgi:hypothetical protein
VFQVNDDNGSDDLVISGNKIYGSIDQIKNVNDLDALIEVGGGVTDVDIVSNTLSWNGAFGGDLNTSSGTQADKSDVTDVDGNAVTYQSFTQGVLLYGDIDEGVYINGNTFRTDTTSDKPTLEDNYISAGIFLDNGNTDYGTLDVAVTGSNTNGGGYTENYPYVNVVADSADSDFTVAIPIT